MASSARGQAPGDVEIRSETQQSEGGVSRADGSVELRKGTIIVTADQAEYDEDSGTLEATGNVRFRNTNGGEDIRASRVSYNVTSEEGTFYDVSGFLSSASQAGARMLTTDNPFHLEGMVVHKTADSYVVHDGVVTNCDLDDIWWTLKSPQTTVRPGDRAKIKHGVLRLKGVPILYLPYFTKSLQRVPRQSGFLTPNVGNSSRYGAILGQSYYWAINRSYDATLNGTLYTNRGLASQIGFRGRPTSTSNFEATFYGVKDRGLELDNGERLKQGGASFSMNGIAELPAGFRGVVDVNFLSSLEFRQAFTQSYGAAIESQIRSTGFVSKSFSSYSLNASISSEENFQNATDRDNTVIISKMPAFEFNGRTKQVAKGALPLFFAFDSSFDLVSRSQQEFETRNFVQRGDFFPRVSTHFAWEGFHITPTVGARATAYGQGFENERTVGENVYRTAGEISLDIVPPSLERIYDGPKWLGVKVKHVIEPRLRYRYTRGIEDFDTVVRFDYRDIMSNTNEADISLTQRLFAKRADGSTHEILSLELWQRRYFDSQFGGAIVPGRRNILRSSLDVTPFAFIDQHRNYSPVVVSLKTRPNWRTGLEWRADYDPLREKVVNTSATLEYRFSEFIRAVVGHTAVRSPTLSAPSNQITSLVSLGDFNRRGWNLAVSNIYDYRRQNFIYTTSQLSYNTDCCGFGVEYRRFAIGPTRTENQFRLSLSIANVGSFGTLRPQERLF